ncbi:outer membrane protein assembly factor BamB family protein [Kribbella sp. NPDC055071]
MAGLRERWNDVLPDAGPLADDLASRYTGPSRNAYRDLYLETVLTALKELDQLSTDPTAVELAAWFHRAVHERGNTPAEDAEASARLAEDVLPGYDVTAARTEEVARLVRLTGGLGELKDKDPNGAVLLDAVNAVLADRRYQTHSAQVRRDAGTAESETRRRYDEIRTLLNAPIYRTGLGRDRFEDRARTNLETELTTLEGLIPAPWAGWQRAALIVCAVLIALSAFLAAFGATRQPWRVPAYSEDAVWPAVVLAVLALAAVPVVYRYSRRPTRAARTVAGVMIAVGVIGIVAVWIKSPETTEGSGIGARVPLLVISSALLIVAGVACVAASRQRPRPRNRGQLLAGAGVAVVIVLALFFVIDPLERTFLLAANEHLEGQHPPAAQNVRSELTGAEAWSVPAGNAGDSLRDMAATNSGIAVSRQTGTIEMLDPASGQVRWRYTRSDSNEHPRLYVIDGGRSLLADFDDLGYFVLAADTGRRTAAWGDGTKDYFVDNRDPLVTGRSVSKGSDKVFGMDTDGSSRWTYAPGTCTDISAAATADAVVVGLSHSCGTAGSELVGLNVKEGKQLWRHPESAGNLTAVGGSVVGIVPDPGTSGTQGTLIGIEPRSGEIKWRQPLPKTGTCPPTIETADNLVVLMSCESPTRTGTTAFDASTGRQVWSATTPVPYGQAYGVTSDGRVVFGDDAADGCRLTTVGAHPATQLAKGVQCDRGVVAAGNLVLAVGDRTIVALR